MNSMTNFLMSPYLPIIYIAAIIAVYVLLFAIPNKQRQKKAAALLNNLQVHNKILTVGGILAEVEEIHGDFVKVRLSEENNCMTIHRSAIQRIVQQGALDSAIDF